MHETALYPPFKGENEMWKMPAKELEVTNCPAPVTPLCPIEPNREFCEPLHPYT